jgi:hypothetical protein
MLMVVTSYQREACLIGMEIIFSLGMCILAKHIGTSLSLFLNYTAIKEHAL